MKSADSSSSGTWWYPFSASTTVKKFIPGGTVRTAWNGVVVSYLGLMILLLRFLKSTHKRIPPFFFGTSTMGCTHAVGAVTFSMIVCSSNASSSSFSCGSSGSATGRDPLIATGVAPSFSTKWHGGPFIVLHLPTNVSGNVPMSACFSASFLSVVRLAFCFFLGRYCHEMRKWISICFA